MSSPTRLQSTSDALSMEEFSRHVAHLNRRVNGLRSNLGLHPEPSDNLTAEAFEALGSTMEGLRVAEEQLRRTNGLLAASYEAVEAESRRYRDLFEMAPDAYLVTDTLGVIREANLAACALTGVERRFLIGKPLAVLVPEEDRHAFRAEMAGHSAGGVVRQFEMRLRPRNNVILQVAASVYTDLDRASRATTLRWAFRDVSARKRSEEQFRPLDAELQDHAIRHAAQLDADLLANEELLIQAHASYAQSEAAGQLFHDLVQDLDAIIWKADAATGAYSFVSRHAETILGIPAGRWVEDPRFWLDRVHPDDREYAATRRRKAAQSGDDVELEYRMLDAEGRAVWFREGLRLLRDERTGLPTELRGLMVNITKRKKVERQLYAAKNELMARLQDLSYLQELGRRLAGTLELQPILSEILSAVVSIQGAESGTLLLHDATRDELVPAAALGFDDGFLARLRKISRGEGACGLVLATGERLVVEDVRKDPEHAPPALIVDSGGFRAIHSIPLRTSRGEFLGTIAAYFREPHRPHERQVQLVQRYASQAADFLAGARLLGELRDAGRRKDEFLASVAHELRTPLAPILSALEVLRVADHDPSARAQARSILERQVHQLTSLVDDLMDASRLNYGKVALRKQTVDVGDAVRAAMESARPQVEARGHQLTADLPSERVWIEADPTRLEQILTNLLANAAKYTEPGGRIAVSARREGDHAVLRVRDSGLGLSPEMLHHVFDLFSQEGRTSERAEGGLGLGLALVRRLVEAHGGGVEAASDGPGLGSEFTVRLPVGTPLPLRPARPLDAPVDIHAPAAARRILLVDDDRDATLMLARLLATRGHQVRSADDGPSAIEAARDFDPEVVVLDLTLPGMDGLEVARRLRELSRSATFRLVALTGSEGEDVRRLTSAAGFGLHLIKPVKIDDLDRALAS